MSDHFIPISKPAIGPREKELVLDALDSGWVSSIGKYIDEFEAGFARYCGTEYALAVSNGTTGLHLALATLGLGPGDEVIIPDLTFVATANAVAYTGAVPVLADIDAETLCIDPALVRSLISPRTKAIIPVHLYGHPVELRPVLDLAYRYAVRLTGNRETGLDLVQDASLAAFRAFHQYAPGTNFRAWFMKVLTRRFLRLQQATTSSSIPLDDAPDLFLYLHAKRLGVPMEGDPSAFVMSRFDGEQIGQALQKLSPEFRAAATLHFLSEMTYDECAEALDVPVGTVRSRIHRARKLLQVALWRMAEERGYVAQEESS